MVVDMTATTTAAPATHVKPNETNPQDSAGKPDSVNLTNEDSDLVEDSATEKTETKPDGRRGRNPHEAIEARSRNATYRKAEQSARELRALGWTVAPPSDWVSPEVAKARETYEKAQAALRALGIDPASVSLPPATVDGEPVKGDPDEASDPVVEPAPLDPMPEPVKDEPAKTAPAKAVKAGPRTTVPAKR